MSKKTILLQKNLPAEVTFSVTSPITSNAVQQISFYSQKSNSGLQLDNTTLIIDKNSGSDSFRLTGTITGNFNLTYTLHADYTNEKKNGDCNIYVSDPENSINGFKNINGCLNMLFIKEGSEYRDGSIVAFYTSPDANAHTVSISSTSNEGYTVFAIDPNYNTYIHSSISQAVTINVTSQGLWQFVPAHNFIINVSGDPSMVPEGKFTMFADSVECCGTYAFYQGISYLPLNGCNIPNP